MTAPSHVPLPPEEPDFDAAAFRRQGMIAGVFGAILLAAWFLYLDVVRGHPLFTPTLLAKALLSGGAGVESPETLPGSIPLTLLFTVVHSVVFVLIGLGAAEILIRFVHVRSRALIVLLLFCVLSVAFLAVALNVAAVGSQAIALRDAFVGNAIASLGMAAYLARNMPPPAR